MCIFPLSPSVTVNRKLNLLRQSMRIKLFAQVGVVAVVVVYRDEDGACFAVFLHTNAAGCEWAMSAYGISALVPRLSISSSSPEPTAELGCLPNTTNPKDSELCQK